MSVETHRQSHVPNNTTGPKKQKKMYSVGPANLPDGTYRRKVQKIKKTLVGSAKIRKEYEKIKQHELRQQSRAEPETQVFDEASDIHPEQQWMLDGPEAPNIHTSESEQSLHKNRRDRLRKRRPKQIPFNREILLAKQRQAEIEMHQKAREDAEIQRQQKHEERERSRKAMAKARAGGLNGQRRLGRESKVLLERVQRMIGQPNLPH